MYKAVDVMGFAGGFTLGMVQAGFELVGKRELPGGFGVPNCEANRDLLGYNWNTEIGPGETWSGVPADVVFGNPPCSGFSVMTAAAHRGIDANVNACMWHFHNYVAKVRPMISIMESVRVAFTQGRPLMQNLRRNVEILTGEQWNLFHVYQDAVELGGAAKRPRYFCVLSRIPFGVDYPTVQTPVLRDVIEDLDGLHNTWEPQPYRRPPTWWSKPARSDTGVVDGHKMASNPNIERALNLLEHNGDWPQGWAVGRLLKDYYQRTGDLPPLWQPYKQKLIEKDFFMGFTTMVRWREDKPARVITGAALGSVLHPWEPRPITHREAARIMGFPDDWRIKPIAGNKIIPTWGKGITVQCGKWIGANVIKCLDGQPGSVQGDEIGDREFFITAPKDRQKDLVSSQRRFKTEPVDERTVHG